MKKTGCVFCEPDTRDYAFLESKNFLAIYNISPILPGHSLIIPKKHIISFLELSQEELTEFIILGQKAASTLSSFFNSGSFNLSIQDGQWAGQTLFHLHMHIIPRKKGDLKKPGDWYPELEKKFYDSEIDSSSRPKLSRDEMLKTVENLKRFIG